MLVFKPRRGEWTRKCVELIISSNPGPAIEVLKVLPERCNNGFEDSFLEFVVVEAGVPNIRGTLQAPSNHVAIPTQISESALLFLGLGTQTTR